MSTTKDFDNFPDDMKKCQNKETMEECSNRKLMKEAAKQCGCLPAIVNHFKLFTKVTKESFLFKHLLGKDGHPLSLIHI